MTDSSKVPAPNSAQRNETARSRLVFLDYLRATAIILVLWDHLVGHWLDQAEKKWLPSSMIDRVLTNPLGITQHFGWLGVVLFFLVSGFIISHVANVESRLQFAIKRVFRIYPPLIATVAVTIAVIAYQRAIGSAGPGSSAALPSWHDALLNMTLVNYFLIPQNIIVGVAWSLVIEVIFYCAILVLRPLLDRHGAIAAALLLTAIFGVIATCRDFGAGWFLFSASVSYLPILVIGQVIWLKWSDRVRLPTCIFLIMLAWATFVFGLERLQPRFLVPGVDSYGPSIAIALAIFVLATQFDARQNRFVRYIADRSYSIYLFHGVIGLWLLDLLASRVNYEVALIGASAAVLIIAELNYRYVESTSRRSARWLIKWLSRGGRRTAESSTAAGPTTPTPTPTPRP